jgi:tetratricopeptide (TPR) repeat protein
MRKLTSSLIHLLLVVVAVSLVSCSPAARKARYLSKADKYFADGKYDEAEVEYMNTLRVDGENPAAISRLSVIYFNQGRLSRAIPFLLKSRTLQPDNLDLRVKLAAIYLSTGKRQEAREECNFVLDRQPSDNEAPLVLAGTAFKAAEVEEVRQRLQGLPAPAPSGAPVLVALGTLALRQNDLKAAEAAFKQAQSVDTKSSAAAMGMANLYLMQNDLPQAEAAFKAAAELAPSRSPRRLQYAQFKIQHGDLAAGKQLLEEITSQVPDYLPAWIKLAEIAAGEKKFNDCAALLNKVLARDGLHYDALLLRARLKLAQREASKAVVELEQMATLYAQSPEVHYHLALAHAADNQDGKAISSLTQAVAIEPQYAEAIIFLAGLKIKTGDPAAAVASLKPLVQRRPRYAQGHFLLATAYQAQGNLDEAAATYRRLMELFPKSPQAPMYLGLVLLQQNQKPAARQAFEKVLELAPDSLTAIEQLVRLDLAERQYAPATQRVEKVLEKNPKLAPAHVLLATIHLAQKDQVRAEAALTKAVELQPDYGTAYLMLARMYVESNQHPKALEKLQVALTKNTNDIASLTLMGMLQGEQKNYPAARDAYEKILAINPKFAPALNNLAWLYAANLGQTEKAYELARRARELSPGDPRVADTLGWILYLKGQYTSALHLLTECAEKLPAEPTVQFHLAQTHYMLGQEAPARLAFERALQLKKPFDGQEESQRRLTVLALDPKTATPEQVLGLEKTLATQPDDPVVLDRLAKIYERDGTQEKLVATYQTVLQANPKSVRALIGSAQIHALQPAEIPKAFELAKTAYKHAPDDPRVVRLLGRLAYRSADYKWALSLLQQSARTQAGDPELLFDLAEASYSMGLVKEAEESTRQALAAGASFTRTEEAKRLLEMLTLGANPERAISALAQIESLTRQAPDYVPAWVVLAVIGEQKSDFPAARLSYEKVLGRYPDFTSAKKRLAILYALDPKDNQRAYELAVSVRAAYPDDAELTRVLGITTYRKGEYAKALELLKTSAAAYPQDATVAFYLGLTQYQLKQRDAGKQSLQRALELNLPGDLAVEAKRVLAELK